MFHADMNVDDMELETLKQAVATAASYGVSLEMIHIEPYIAGGKGMASITAAEEPGREESIQSILRMIENAGKAGIRGLNYNFHPVSLAYDSLYLACLVTYGLLLCGIDACD